MAVIEIKFKPSPRELRQFAALLIVFSILAGFVIWLKTGSIRAPAWLWSVGGVWGLAGLLIPRLIWPAYIGLMILAYPIGLVVSYVLLAVIFFGLFMPIGLLMRLLGRDPLQRRFDPKSSTYWVKHSPQETTDYFHQF